MERLELVSLFSGIYGLIGYPIAYIAPLAGYEMVAVLLLLLWVASIPLAIISGVICIYKKKSVWTVATIGIVFSLIVIALIFTLFLQ
ncbi:MAG TPA: hypothetical protein VJB66_01905 [Candidatus Nanoarchaeia archaeon]|nr:hypothetical protein [Candidatus Nanoarchaeia archaeon]